MKIPFGDIEKREKKKRMEYRKVQAEVNSSRTIKRAIRDCRPTPRPLCGVCAVLCAVCVPACYAINNRQLEPPLYNCWQ